MNLAQLFVEGKDDNEHFDALERTGFFGAQAAGCIFFADDTKRFMIAHRSANVRDVQEPGTWGTFGGAIDRGEDPAQAVRREVQEETGYHDAFSLKPLYVFRSGTFRYSNFLAIVPHEFKPILDWENQGFIWTEYGEWPHPLHFGFVSLIKDRASAKVMLALTKSP